MMDGMNNCWGMGYGWIIGLIVLVIIIGLIVNAMKQKKKKYNSPLDILKTRYAKGEISKDEYDEKRRHIS